MFVHVYSTHEVRWLIVSFFHVLGLSQATIEKLMDFMEKYIMTRLYRAVFCPFTTDDEEQDLSIQNRIRSLHWVSVEQLGAQFQLGDPNVRALVDSAITGRCGQWSLVA